MANQTEHVTKVQKHKSDAVDILKSLFGDSKDFIFADYRGLTVEQITDLRSKLRAQSASFKVVKNSYAKIAFRELDHPEDVAEFLVGPTALALTQDDSGSVAKTLVEAAKDLPLVVKGALVDGSVFNAEQVIDFSKLPTKPELISSLMGTMQAPLQNLVYAMNGVTQKLVRVLQAVADKKQDAA
jgi:large subunit ribosomal protein L10